jgi:hypothetical protein
MFLEVIYETGAHSIMEADDENEAVDAIREQNRRAENGEMGGPGNRPAERVYKVLKYDKHPNDFNIEQVVSEAEVKAAFKDILAENIEDGVVHLPQFLADMRLITSPQVDSEPHESNYKMQETGELKWGEK